MKKIFLFILIPFFCKSQLIFSEQKIDLGVIAEAYEIKGDVIVTNNSGKKIFLMRADADRGVKIYTSKKTLLAGDTCLLVISFIPEENGKFNKLIKLVSTDKETPYELNLNGTLTNVKTNDRMACVYFGKRKTANTTVKSDPIIVPNYNSKRDNSNKMPGSDPVTVPKQDKPIAGNTRTNTETHRPSSTIKEKPTGFSETEYKPNNILFLVDVSSSMRDSLKLPLMKIALHKLINEVRGMDTITLVTYTKVILYLVQFLYFDFFQYIWTII